MSSFCSARGRAASPCRRRHCRWHTTRSGRDRRPGLAQADRDVSAIDHLDIHEMHGEGRADDRFGHHHMLRVYFGIGRKSVALMIGLFSICLSTVTLFGALGPDLILRRPHAFRHTCRPSGRSRQSLPSDRALGGPDGLARPTRDNYTVTGLPARAGYRAYPHGGPGRLTIIPSDRDCIPACFGDMAAVGGVTLPIHVATLLEGF